MQQPYVDASSEVSREAEDEALNQRLAALNVYVPA